jgi:hypothetical protein
MYMHIDDTRADKAQIVSQFPLGESSYGLRYKHVCFGTIRFVTQVEGGSLTINGSGSLKVKYQGVEHDVTLESQASFNALRQLGGSYLKIESPQISLLFATLNIRPIELVVRLTNPAQGTIFSSQMAGPIEFKSLDNNMIAIVGLTDTDALSNLSLLSGQPLFKDLLISHERDDDNQRCDRAQLSSLDLAPILKLAQALTHLLPQGLVP